MELFDAERVRALLHPATLVEALRAGFAEADQLQVPDRVSLTIDAEDGSTLLLKPCWRRGGMGDIDHLLAIMHKHSAAHHGVQPIDRTQQRRFA